MLRILLLLITSAVFLAAPAVAKAPSNPHAIAVIIANGQYKNEIPPVDYAGNDGDAMRAFLIDVLGYRDGNIIDLRNAGQAEILAVFGNETSHKGKLWSWVRQGRSDVFVYYSGHGAPGLNDKRGYLLPVDSDPATVEINGYSLDLLYRNLAKLKARSVTVMLDACFSGASEAGLLIKAASPVFVKTVANDVSQGITVLSAARGDQVASWDRKAKLGLFTNFVLNGLYGKADGGEWGNGDGKVTLSEVQAYLDDEMSYAARRRFTRVQQASAIGEPNTVLVPRVPEKPRQVAAYQAPKPAKPVATVAAYSLYERWRRSGNPQDLVLEPEIPSAYGSPPAEVKGPQISWKLQSSFYGGIPVLGRAAIGFIQKIEKYSQDTMKIQFFHPGQPTAGWGPSSVVAQGDVEIGYSTAYFDFATNPEMANFSAVPFGLNVQEALAWYLSGSHDKLLAEAYKHVNVVPMACALMGAEGGGYFEHHIKSAKQYADLKMRITDLPAVVAKRLGSKTTPKFTDTVVADLEAGTLDAIEFATPYIDLIYELGIERVRSDYHYPAWHQMSYFNHVFVNKDRWNELSTTQQQVIRYSCKENIIEWVEKDFHLARDSIQELRDREVSIKPFNPKVIADVRQAWNAVLAEQTPKFRQIHSEMMRFKKSNYIFE
ncbi:MAG: hypothetical protein HOH65_12675 [Rhodospirillaceae bacterium]|nr:hypothetical protein [Rhodospirillaceae bacterium]